MTTTHWTRNPHRLDGFTLWTSDGGHLCDIERVTLFDGAACWMLSRIGWGTKMIGEPGDNVRRAMRIARRITAPEPCGCGVESTTYNVEGEPVCDACDSRDRAAYDAAYCG